MLSTFPVVLGDSKGMLLRTICEIDPRIHSTKFRCEFRVAAKWKILPTEEIVLKARSLWHEVRTVAR